MKHCATVLALPLLLLCQPAVLPAQSEAQAIKAFKKGFKPSTKALEKAMQGSESLATNDRRYTAKLNERNTIAEGWKAAVYELDGYGSPAVAKLLADAWVKVDKAVGPAWKEHAKLDKRVAKEFAKILKLTDGEGIIPKKEYPMKVIAAQQNFLLASRRASEVRRNITDLTTLQEALRLVVSKVTNTSGLTWFLENTVGSKKYGLALKVEAIRASANQGAQMISAMIAGLDKAKKPDEIAALVQGLGMLKEQAKAATPKLIELLQSNDAGVREQAALALQHMKAPESIEPMIQVLAREGGLTRKRIAAALEILTGQQHGTNASAWQSWFASEGAAYAAGKVPLGNGKPSAHEEYNKKNYYYGIPQDGKSILYIIDCSGSMVLDKDNPQWEPNDQRPDNPIPIPAENKADSRGEASKRELSRALEQLHSNKTFNIVWYNHAATAFKKKMVPATPDNIKAAQKWLEGLPAYSSTNIYDAVKMAFTFAGRGAFDSAYDVQFEQIFLMTDGKPTLQGVGDDDPMKIVEGARKWNSMKRVQIHTIAFGTKDIDHDFMHMLADENGGEYRIVLPDGVKKYEEIKDKLPKDRGRRR
ncbi:MAG: HEAT repeat domain-containing protein [Planctomycetota bacterium]|jgi:Mg-chelatase subunit ChlD